MSSLIVTVLTGHRPELLARTLETSLPMLAPVDPVVVAFHNGAPPGPADDTGLTLREWERDGYIDRIVAEHEWLGIGEAVSRCAHFAAMSGADYWLHLEDDWAADPADPNDWYPAACDLLDSGTVGQVKLRHITEKTLPHNMVTRRRIRWRSGPDGYRIGDAHYTFNPAMIRTVDIPDGFPCTGEQDTQRRWYRKHRTTAQADPGIWRHIGDGHSLRKALQGTMTKPNHWPINDDTARLLDEYLTLRPPKLAVDVGAGRSTVIIARHAARTVGLEHAETFGNQTRRLLNLELNSQQKRATRLILAPLVTVETPVGTQRWYDVKLPDGIDFALIDGPPGYVGRGGGLPRLWPHLADDWEIWLDDWDRDAEKQIVESWQAHYPIDVEPVSDSVVRLLPK